MPLRAVQAVVAVLGDQQQQPEELHHLQVKAMPVVVMVDIQVRLIHQAVVVAKEESVLRHLPTQFLAQVAQDHQHIHLGLRRLPQV
jgi:hypothetical protein